LLKIPLVAGVAITTLDVLVVLFFYRPNGSMKGLRFFEMFVAALVLAVVICFCIELGHIKDTPVAEVFKGYLPSKAIASGQG
jgi:metal iron transporter